MVTLLKRYSGQAAQQYDQIRHGSRRWAREIQVFNHYLEKLQPKSVLDCPVGTARWVDQYKTLPGPIIGVDLSADMLEQAGTKFEGYEGALHFLRADALAYDFRKVVNPDLLVCVRFLNWLPAQSASQVVSNLSRSHPTSAIVGVSVRPQKAPVLTSMRMRFALSMTNLRRWLARRPLQHVHDEEEVLRWFAMAGWEVEERQPIFHNRSRINYFYLLRRKSRPAQ